MSLKVTGGEMDIDRAANVSFFDFVGGVQLLQGEDTRVAMPVILIGICVSGAVGNLLVLLIFMRDFRNGKGSEVKVLLASLASTDSVILLLCAPVRAVTYYRQTWTLGSFLCSTADWFQHSCVVAKTLILAATTRAEHTVVPRAATGPPNSPTWIHGALALIWVVSMLFPIPQMLFASVVQRGGDTVCVSQMPACASDFMSLFYKIYPTAAFAVPITFTLGYYTKTLHSAVNHAPSPQHQSKVTLVLLCLSGALGLMLLPEWGTFTWIRLGYNKPPVGLIIFAQVLLYACSSLSPVILMTIIHFNARGLPACIYSTYLHILSHL
uniref:G-protein coupled receptors family 1 profile domain-containing protein n=1 Tax=Mola mola TaxID=94237 RepID=A0A3Q3XB19_MOLML